MSKKGGGTKSRSFGQGAGDLKRKGYSEESARRIMGRLQADQDKSKKKKKKS